MSRDGSLRWAWLLPGVAAAALTVVVVLVVRVVVVDDDVDGLARSPASSSTSTAHAEPAPTTAPPTEDPVSRLHLRGDGLDMVGLGDPQEDVIRTLVDVLGAPDEQDDEPCAGHQDDLSHWVRWADLSLRFDDGTFAGYIEGIHFPPGPPPVDLPTSTGLSPGDPLARASQLYPGLRVRQSATPGQQDAGIFTFSDPDGTPTMFGVVEGTGEGQLVVSIYAGDLC